MGYNVTWTDLVDAQLKGLTINLTISNVVVIVVIIIIIIIIIITAIELSLGGSTNKTLENKYT